MIRHSHRGFSLLELMVVVAIIMILGAIAIPNFFRARQNAYEASAAGFLHTLQTEQIAYRASNGSYATSFSQLPGLGGTPVDPSSAGGAGGPQGNQGGSGAGGYATSTSGAPTSTIIRDSYIFTLTSVNDEQWFCTADPILDRYNGRYFYTDESGVVRSAKGTPAANSGYLQ